MHIRVVLFRHLFLTCNICNHINYQHLFFLPFQKCLDKDPEKRYSCEQLFHHPYFDGFNKSEFDYDVLSSRLRREKLKVKLKPKSFLKILKL